jgi:predicted Zn-dependent protease
MPVTALDRTLARYDVMELESDFPFREDRVEFILPPPANPVERLAQRVRSGELPWLQAMDQLLQLYRRQGRLAEAVVVARVVARAAPADPTPQYVTGVLLMQLGQLDRARRYLEHSLALDPGNADARAALERLHRRAAATPP